MKSREEALQATLKQIDKIKWRSEPAEERDLSTELVLYLMEQTAALRDQNSVLRALVREAYREGWSDCCIEEGSQYFIDPVEDGWAESDVRRAMPPAIADQNPEGGDAKQAPCEA